jgi:glucose-6-phosphate isomerase
MEETMSIRQILVRCAAGEIQKAYDDQVDRLRRDRFVGRLLAKDDSLFGTDPGRRSVVAQRLDWLDSPGWIASKAASLKSFTREIEGDGIRHVVLLGMGGSSLCPEVLSMVFGRPPYLQSFSILDATDPSAIRRIEEQVDLATTLFIVASKSGSTTETRAQADYFFAQLQAAGLHSGRQFVAITDPGSTLAAWAQDAGFRQLFLNPAKIGGRYSALSYFGMVPASLLQLPLTSLADHANTLLQALSDDSPQNAALSLGALMGAAALHGQDKLTFITSARLAPVVPWIEQLVAESTGKEGRGIVPIEAEPTTALNDYAGDRLFCTMRLADEEPSEPLFESIHKSDRPHAEIVVRDLQQIGALFLMWELAVSAAGYVLDINPYDEPNVRESKDNTQRLLKVWAKSGRFEETGSFLTRDAFDVWASGIGDGDLSTLMDRLAGRIDPGGYLAMLHFGDRSGCMEPWLGGLREHALRALGVATLRGYGPRYLHSIGQLYKGGRQNGAFVIITLDPAFDCDIPSAGYSFAQLLRAQALGDFEALAIRGRPVLRVHLKGNTEGAQRSFYELWCTLKRP